ncbi:hypothetical protein BHM03_00021372 [Ensete ventricosum]|nr:hypothetical protein BHM03_00021372 [Ensete ventricosum]
MHRVDAVGNSPGVHREHVEGIGSLPGWRKGVPQKKIETRQKIVGNWETHWEHAGRLPEEDRKARRKNARGCRIGGRFGLHPTKIDSGRRCASRKRT